MFFRFITICYAKNLTRKNFLVFKNGIDYRLIPEKTDLLLKTQKYVAIPESETARIKYINEKIDRYLVCLSKKIPEKTNSNFLTKSFV